MGDIQVRRLPVVNRDKRLVGIVSLGDVAQNEDRRTSGKAIAGVSQARREASAEVGSGRAWRRQPCSSRLRHHGKSEGELVRRDLRRLRARMGRAGPQRKAQ
jgi:hypothetical protein